MLLLLGCEAPAGNAEAKTQAAAKTPIGAAPKQKPKEIPLADQLLSPFDEDRPVADKLRSPRETLKTLYFAVLTYDLFPRMIEDAIACLDLDALQPRPAPEDAAMLALDLEYVLQSLALPLSGVPDQGAGERIVLHDADSFKLALRHGDDGGWRFDAQTLEALPAMRRAAQARHQKQSSEASALREGFTDPRAADLDQLFATLKQQQGRLDVLFANAGVPALAPLGEITEEHFDQVFLASDDSSYVAGIELFVDGGVAQV